MRNNKNAKTPECKPYRYLNQTNKILQKATAGIKLNVKKTQQKIVQLLKKKGPMTVSEICIKLLLEQSVVSQHLTYLRQTGVVARERQGKFIYYHFKNPEKITALAIWVEQIYKLGPLVALAKLMWELFEFLT